MLLEGSEGGVRAVILVKVEPIDPKIDECLSRGFVEVWAWDPEIHCIRRRGPRMVIIYDFHFTILLHAGY
jgi:hypothetical protein